MYRTIEACIEYVWNELDTDRNGRKDGRGLSYLKAPNLLLLD